MYRCGASSDALLRNLTNRVDGCHFMEPRRIATRLRYQSSEDETESHDLAVCNLPALNVIGY